MSLVGGHNRFHTNNVKQMQGSLCAQKLPQSIWGPFRGASAFKGLHAWVSQERRDSTKCQ